MSRGSGLATFCAIMTHSTTSRHHTTQAPYSRIADVSRSGSSKSRREKSPPKIRNNDCSYNQPTKRSSSPATSTLLILTLVLASLLESALQITRPMLPATRQTHSRPRATSRVSLPVKSATTSAGRGRLSQSIPPARHLRWLCIRRAKPF